MLTHILVTPMCMQLLHIQHVTRSGLPHNVMHSSSIYVVHGQILCVQTSDKAWHCILTSAARAKSCPDNNVQR